MTPSLMSPAAAPFFFRSFEAIPETGSLMVPIQIHPLTSVTEPRELTPQTAVPFARTLGAAISEISSLFPPDLFTAPLPGEWTALHGGSKHLLLENHREGRALRFDRGGRLTERITGHRSGLALSVRRYGLFTSVDMAQAINLKRPLRWIPHYYAVQFEACGVAALKGHLRLPPDLPLLETGLALYRGLGMDGEPAGHSFLESEISGVLAEGATRIHIRTGLDSASLAQGELCETLALEVYPADPADQRLAAPLLPLWRLALSLADQYRRDDASTSVVMADYFHLTRGIYGDVPLILDPEDIN